MLDLELATPIYLLRQLASMERGTGLSFRQLRQLAFYESPGLGIVTEDTEQYRKFDLIGLQGLKESDEGDASWVYKKDVNAPFIAGIKGVRWLCEQKGLGIEPLNRISIPDSVFEECNQVQWYDISTLYGNVSRKNSSVKRLTTMPVPLPDAILVFETRGLWEEVELLECGHIGRSTRHWTHGRILRSLNDIGYSLIDGWAEGLRESIDVLDETEEEKRARHQRMREMDIRRYSGYYRKRGMSESAAYLRALDRVNGNPSFRVSTVEGMGIQFEDDIPQRIVADFLQNHQRSFIQSEAEQKIYDRIQAGEELSAVFEDSNYELNGPGYGFEHWAIAVANVMIRETGLSFAVHTSEADEKYPNRSCIIFPDKAPWLYNEKEKCLSRNMLYQILDRYALELHLTVARSCYFIMDVEDG